MAIEYPQLQRGLMFSRSLDEGEKPWTHCQFYDGNNFCSRGFDII